MQRLLFISLLLAPFFQLWAQPPGVAGPRPGAAPSILGRISGIVLDSTNRQPVEFAAVALWDLKQNKQIDGIIGAMQLQLDTNEIEQIEAFCRANP